MIRRAWPATRAKETVVTLPEGLTPGVWTLDMSHSEVGFSVRHIFTPVKGEFKEWNGYWEYGFAQGCPRRLVGDADIVVMVEGRVVRFARLGRGGLGTGLLEDLGGRGVGVRGEL